MSNWLIKRFALTKEGARGLIRSTTASFCSHIVKLFPAFLLMFFLEKLLIGNSITNQVFYITSVAVIILLYWVLGIEYTAQFDATYKESENLRIEIARNMRKLPLSFFSKNNVADLSQTIMEDVAGIEHALSHAIGITISFFFYFIILSFLLLMGNVKLGLAVIIPTVLSFACIFISKKVQVAGYGKHIRKLRKNSDSFQEAIELQQEIKSFGLGEKIKASLSRQLEESETLRWKEESKIGCIMVASECLLYFSMIGVVFVGLSMLEKQEISLLYLLGYLITAIKIKDGSEGIEMNISEMFHIHTLVQRIQKLKNTPLQTGEKVDINQYDIVVKDMSFSYDVDTKVLEKVSFTAKQNEVTALVGHSGCGKTSILRLVSRLYDYDSGSIEIGGKDVKTIDTKSLFDKISIVFQDVMLFHNSILENIRIGNVNATDEEVKQAARLANCEEFIEKLPNGYDTFIGENGANLSGGERQRLSIARAFLKNAPIILLDEISASLDVENEQKIQESLNKLTKNKTVLIISHRLKSIENVDRIVVFSDGKVEASGTHKELIERSKTYQKLLESTRLAEEFVY